MKRIVAKLKTHALWYRYSSNVKTFDDLSINEFLSEKHHFTCGNICNLDISNEGILCFDFEEETPITKAREYCAIFLYFVSICNGSNCEFDTTAIIDDISVPNFFSYPEEDKTDLPLLKNSKFYEISLGDIKDIFGDILFELFSYDKRFILSLLSNYYSTIFYKDFIGNGIYKFRNMVANVESIITTLNAVNYTNIENTNKEFLKTLSQNTEIKVKEIKKHLSPRRISLKEKLIDCFKHLNKFGLKFKLDYNKECEKIANTRNFVSHLFDTQMTYLTDQEIYDYTAVLEEIFRMLLLELCGINADLISQKFLRNAPIRLTFSKCFDFVSDKSEEMV